MAGLRQIAENGQTESAKVRAFELLGKPVGIFRDEQPAPWDGDLNKLSLEQLERMAIGSNGSQRGSRAAVQLLSFRPQPASLW